MGKNQKRLLLFALRYPAGWHGYGRDESTVRALRSLANNGFIEVSRETRQFRLAIERKDEFAPSGGREPNNEDRAAWASLALDTFMRATGADRCDAIGDFLADLRHLGDRDGEDVEAIFDRSLAVYLEEIEESPKAGK